MPTSSKPWRSNRSRISWCESSWNHVLASKRPKVLRRCRSDEALPWFSTSSSPASASGSAAEAKSISWSRRCRSTLSTNRNAVTSAGRLGSTSGAARPGRTRCAYPGVPSSRPFCSMASEVS
ncbi:hypothetical protein [Glycomyces niveus]|uniref:Uncharacterized protein n=1 Tax=Glycomyces niveus TaxID=2820287 RepID=A0ABS3U158_9ACTN|nr:hypothetical protein [Glycomyces sp. NEAU-S30]MBO3732507.1 hypothetical protein [Glycomyces sp. NEAU-S30]